MPPPSAPNEPEPGTPFPRRSALNALSHQFTPRSYPHTGVIAVGARVVFLAAGLTVLVAALGPHQFKPRIVGHYHLQRFAAWYLLSGMAAAALPKARLRWLALVLILFAVGAEFVRALPRPFTPGFKDNVYADIGGVYALMFPLILARWREAVQPRPGSDGG